ncbi:hypothetical protein [Cellulomonas sp. JZ18]|uniref:hypothetical protein n=1 Tax=Cellulomonas sp. JZ18 TaxID=2654191 RepID=UPI0018AF57FA|nr:hypothetical protein [Cellulomonas sp. JZ18]
MPLLRPAIAATGVALTIGFLMNDSGIVVLALGIAVSVPCLVAAAAQWRLENDALPPVADGGGTVGATTAPGTVSPADAPRA